MVITLISRAKKKKKLSCYKNQNFKDRLDERDFTGTFVNKKAQR